MIKLIIFISLILISSVGYCQDTDGSPQAASKIEMRQMAGQIKAEEIIDFIKVNEEVLSKPLDNAGLEKMIMMGSKLFRKGLRLPEPYKTDFMDHFVSTRGKGADEVRLHNFLNNAVGQEKKYWDEYIVIMTLELDTEGRVVDFYWDRPMLLTDKIIDTEQLSIFLRYVRQQNFWGLSNKGHEIFRKERAFSKEYRQILAKYLEAENDGITTYNFYSEHSAGAKASAYLTVNAKTGKVINFEAVEAILAPAH